MGSGKRLELNMSEKIIISRVFTNEEFGSVRAIVKKGNPLFCGADVAKALGFVKPYNALDTHCKGASIYVTIQTNGGPQTVRFITEGDMYRFLVSSKLKDAQRFGFWIFDDVIPALRHDGARMVAKDEMLEQIIARAVLLAQLQGTVDGIAAYLNSKSRCGC